MSQAQVNFEFEDEKYKCINIPSDPKIKMDKLIDQFKNKVKLDPKDYIFSSKNEEINRESTIADLQQILGNTINISVRKRTKFTKCPDCNNTCFLKIENYGLHFSGCKNHPYIIKTFDDYEDSQKINYNKVRCAKCRKNRIEVNEMYKCLTCSKKNKDASLYICNTCLLSHNKKGEKQHKVIKYDDKNYYCFDGYEYTAYCQTCKRNLCKICLNQHLKDEIIKYDDIAPKIEERQKELEEIKKKLEDAKSSIENLLKMINDAYETLENYYKISNDILDKYVSYNRTYRNYHIIQNINFLEKSNKEVLKHLDYLIEGDNSKDSYLEKCKVLFDIYHKERKNYAGENIIYDDKPQKKEIIQSENNNNNQKSSKEKKNGRSLSNKAE